MSLLRVRSLPVIGLGMAVVIGFIDAVFGALIWANGEVPAVIVTHIVVMPMSILILGMGALILARYPGHLIGKVMSVCGVLIALVTIAEAYSQYGLISRPGSLPAAEYAAWFATWAWVPAGVPHPYPVAAPVP